MIHGSVQQRGCGLREEGGEHDGVEVVPVQSNIDLKRSRRCKKRRIERRGSGEVAGSGARWKTS
ncbi:uncharacterized protein HKW66_Vig0096140 [Vigna angularis]|uniref:Uncharacterized protein n=1 Tax=Phaseolus angularis TaxID=3914 RepID=A0A8T0KN68_PHAAN|nr:uncharacterized protein HKW66_Vig0096140 [Vigna angularis]